MLSPRAIASQGLGFGQRLTAVQGLWPAQVIVSASGGRGAGQRDALSARRLRELDEEDALVLLMTMTAGMGVLQ